jgi:hypothetical protein
MGDNSFIRFYNLSCFNLKYIYIILYIIYIYIGYLYELILTIIFSLHVRGQFIAVFFVFLINAIMLKIKKMNMLTS